MTEIKIAVTAIYRPEEYVMHIRRGDKKRGAIGLIGFIGGQKEEGGTYRDAAAREVSEETNLEIPISQYEAMSGVYKVISDRDNKPAAIWTKLFRVMLPFGVQVEASDPEQDEIIAISTPELVENYIGTGRLSPATDRACRDYLLKDLVILKESTNGVINYRAA